MSPELVLGTKKVGVGQFCFIIAEAGVNHNGQLHFAKKLIDAAVAAGADAVKFQTFITEKVVTKSTGKAPYQQRTTGTSGSYQEMIKHLEFSTEQFIELKAYAEQKGIIFFSTPAEEESADVLSELGVSFFKVDSANLTNLPHLRHLARKGLPLIISTGMANLGDIEDALRAIQEVNPILPVCLLHCVSDYPPDHSTVHLNAIKTMQQAFDVPVGYSDHTSGIEIAVAAVALGAKVIEKHLTLDRTLSGPDQEASLEPQEFKEMVTAIRHVEQALGSSRKWPTPQEQINAKVFRKSIVTTGLIRAGETVTADMLAIKRPGHGLPAKYLPWLLGKKVRRDILADEVVSLDHFFEG